MTVLIILALATTLFAEPWTVGNSGAPGTQSCASSCHGDGAGSVEVHGFPESYYPDSTYLVQLTSTGLTIKNFNASCRVGTTSLNAGVLLGDGITATYSVANENNGVHSLVLDQDTLEFSWVAPIHGTGEVRLYVAAHQGHDTGPNNDLMLIADEIFVQQPPDEPAYPYPVNGADNVDINVNVHWDEVIGADSFLVYFGAAQNPPLVSRQVSITYDPGTLEHETEYFWRVEATNEVGTSSGPLWSFTTEAASRAEDLNPNAFEVLAPYPNPFNGALTVQLNVIGGLPLSIDVFDVGGRFVETLFSGVSRSGLNSLVWQANGPAGVYFIRTTVNQNNFIHKVLYLK